jgi:septal ring factor EnvC (AmiA/AmiB activator)
LIVQAGTLSILEMVGKNINMKDIKEFIKANGRTILIVAIGLFLVSVIFKGGCTVQKKDAEKKAAIEAKKKLEDSIFVLELQNKELQKDISRYDTLAQSLSKQLEDRNAELKKTQGELKSQGGIVKRLIRDANSMVGNSPDSAIRSRLDSATSEIDEMSLRFAYMEYMLEDKDNKIREKDSLLALKDMARQEQIKIKNDEINKLRNAYADIFAKYNLSLDEFNKIAKKATRRGFLNKVLSSGVLAIGTLYLLK